MSERDLYIDLANRNNGHHREASQVIAGDHALKRTEVDQRHYSLDRSPGGRLYVSMMHESGEKMGLLMVLSRYHAEKAVEIARETFQVNASTGEPYNSIESTTLGMLIIDPESRKTGRGVYISAGKLEELLDA